MGGETPGVGEGRDSFPAFLFSGQGDVPVGTPKGFPLALWKPSGLVTRRVALGVQDSRPLLPLAARPTSLSILRATLRVLPACWFSGDGEKARTMNDGRKTHQGPMGKTKTMCYQR